MGNQYIFSGVSDCWTIHKSVEPDFDDLYLFDCIKAETVRKKLFITCRVIKKAMNGLLNQQVYGNLLLMKKIVALIRYFSCSMNKMNI